MNINRFVFLDFICKFLTFIGPVYILSGTEPFYVLSTIIYLVTNFVNHLLYGDSGGFGKYICSLLIGMIINIFVLCFFGSPIFDLPLEVILLAFVLNVHGFQNIGMFAPTATELCERMFPLKLSGIKNLKTQEGR